MVDELAPPVVAVVVTADPGPWLEECLAGLAAQDYANQAVLVVDAASAEPVTARVAAVAPDFYIRRLEENHGYGPSANAVLETVEGAAMLLLCHDDVILEPDALRRMVEEGFRSNAAIVGPKLVSVGDAERLLAVGLDVDRFGAPVRRVEHGELDQSQHDEAREVFAVPGACTLVRADLFAALGGFDPEITMFGEDVDLCWRARLAGARVVVAPAARVAHREATASRQRPLPESRALQWRHELRAVLKNYGLLRRVPTVVELAFFSLAEISYFAAIGKRRRARDVVEAWRWNLAPDRHLREARAAVRALRRQPDRVVCRLFVGRGSRGWRFLRARVEEALHGVALVRPDLPVLGRNVRSALFDSTDAEIDFGPFDRTRPTVQRAVLVPLVLAGLVLLLGARSFLVGHLPLVGQYLPVPGPTTLLGHYFGGWQNAGLGRPGPAPPAFALLGLLGLVFFGATSLVWKLGTIALYVLGAWGVSRVVGRYAGAPARVGAALSYLFLPLGWNDFAGADVQALVAFAVVPFVLGRLLDASRGPERRPGAVLGLGVLLAVAGSFAPLVVVLDLAASGALALGCVLGGSRAGARGALSTGVAGAVVAVVLDLPWALTFFQPGARLSALFGATPAGSGMVRVGALLRFEVGPLGHGLTGYAFLAAALLVLFIGQGERLGTGSRLWVVALGGFAFALAEDRGWFGAGGGSLRLCLALPAACVASCVGLGIASVLTDLARQGLGWRHGVSVLAGVVGLAGLLPLLGASAGGRLGVPETGYDTVLSWVGTPQSPHGARAARVLWLGDGRALPLGGWQIRPGLAAAISSGGLPDLTALWPSPDPGAANAVLHDVVAAESGRTVRLGATLAAAGIRYVVVPTAVAPVLLGTQEPLLAPPPVSLLTGLASQGDLHQLPSEGGVYVFENADYRAASTIPRASAGPGGTPAVWRSLGVACEAGVFALCLLTLARLRRQRTTELRRRRRAAAAAGAPDADDVPATDDTLATTGMAT